MSAEIYDFQKEKEDRNRDRAVKAVPIAVFFIWTSLVLFDLWIDQWR